MSIKDLVAEYLGITPQRGEEWTILCPSPEHIDNRPSASIYVGEPMVRMRGGKETIRLPGMWTCYSCHAAGRISNEAIENYTPTTDRNIEVIEDNLDALEAERRVYPEAWLDLWDYPGGTHPYWLSRFSEATCTAHRLGYDFEREAGTYPLRAPDGSLVGVVRRSLDTDATGWKYRYPKGIDLHAEGFMYGYASVRSSGASVVALCEGALDAVACDEAEQAALAIYGSKISEAQVRLINRLYPDTVILCFDSDAAGRDATNQVLRAGLTCYDVRVVDLGGANDIAELSVEQRRKVLMDATPVSP